MQLSSIVILSFAALGLCVDSADSAAGTDGASRPPPWHPPTGDDRRSPCPMLNSLANHGFLRHTGKNISVEELIDGLDAALNLSPISSRPVAELAVTTSTTGNPLTLNLDDLNTHGVIEHDASLSRNDIFFGDNHSFNSRIFASVSRNFRGAVIDIPTAAKARTERIAAAKRANPQIHFTAQEDRFSQFESALYLRVFGGVDGNAKTAWVKTMFEQERLPYDQGFKRPNKVILDEEIVSLADRVAAASPVV